MSKLPFLTPEAADELLAFGQVAVSVKDPKGGFLHCMMWKRTGTVAHCRLPGRGRRDAPMNECRLRGSNMKGPQRAIWERLRYGAPVAVAKAETEEIVHAPAQGADARPASVGRDQSLMTCGSCGTLLVPGAGCACSRAKPGHVQIVSIVKDPEPTIADLLSAVETASREEVAAQAMAADATRIRLEAEHRLRVAVARAIAASAQRGVA